MGLLQDNEPQSYSYGGLLDEPGNRSGSGLMRYLSDADLLSLAGFMKPTKNGNFGEALMNGLAGAVEGRESQFKRQQSMYEQGMKRKGLPPHLINLGDRYAAINPDTLEEQQSWRISATPTAQLSKGLEYAPDGTIRAIPGWGKAAGSNKYDEQAPLENLRTGNDIFKHGQNNLSDVNKENQLAGPLGNQKWSETTGQNAAKRYDSIIQEGDAAQSDLSNYEKLGTILSDYEGGKLSNARKSFAEYGNSIGIKNLDPNLDEKQLFDAIVGDQTLSRLKMMGGNDSNQDREFAKQIGPSMTQTAAGRKKVIDFYANRAKQRVLRSQLAQQWVNAYGRLDSTNEKGNTFEQRWTDYVNRNPASGGLE